MPQYQQQKKGQARIRVLPKDAMRVQLFLMRHSHGKVQALPNDVYVIEDRVLPILQENGIEFEILEQK